MVTSTVKKEPPRKCGTDRMRFEWSAKNSLRKFFMWKRKEKQEQLYKDVKAEQTQRKQPSEGRTVWLEKDGAGRLAFHENGFPEVFNQSVSPPPGPPLKNPEARGGRPSGHLFKWTPNADGDKLPSFLDMNLSREDIQRKESGFVSNRWGFKTRHGRFKPLSERSHTYAPGSCLRTQEHEWSHQGPVSHQEGCQTEQVTYHMGQKEA